MTNKEIKKVRKEIAVLKRTNPEKVGREIENFLSRLLEENGRDGYQKELETTVKNIIDYYIMQGTEVPESLHSICIQLSDIYAEQGNIERAESVLSNVIDTTLDSEDLKKKEIDISKLKNKNQLVLVMEAVQKLNILKFKNGEQSGRDTIDEINKKGIELGVEEKFSEMDLMDIFSDSIQMEELERILEGGETQSDGENNKQPPAYPPKNQKTQYSPLVYPKNRARFFKESFRDENGKSKIKVRLTKEKFYGYCIIEIEGEDSVILEKFFEQALDENGNRKISQNNATYIVPKDSIIDVLEASNGNKNQKATLRELAKNDERIQHANHRSDIVEPIAEDGSIPFDSIAYYRNFKKKFNISVGHKYFDVAEKTIRGRKPSKGKYKRNIEKNQDIQQADNVETETPEEVAQPEDSKEQLLQKFSTLLVELQECTRKYREAKANRQDIEKRANELEEKMREFEKAKEQLEKSVGE